MTFILTGQDGELAIGFAADHLARAHRDEDEPPLLVERFAIGADLDVFLVVSFLSDGIGIVLTLPDIGEIGRDLLGLRIPFVDAVGDQIAEGEEIAVLAVMPHRTFEELVVLVDCFDFGIGAC
mgnify:CR=1 FL=1